MQRPDPIRTNDNRHASHTMRVRVPGLIRETMRLNQDLPDHMLDGLHLLAVGLENNAPIPMIGYPALDYADWKSAYLAHDGDTWGDTEWFFAEHFVYRHIVEIVDWFRQGRDPFAPKKREEYESPSLWNTLAAALLMRESELPVEDKLLEMFYRDLWGNSIDLSFAQAMSHGATRSQSDLILDHATAAVEYLSLQREVGRVDLLLDNTGTELALDLALVDMLLDGWALTITLHVKQHPTFVSDAIRSDVLDFLAILRARKNPLERALGDRLSAAVQEGVIDIRPDWFWNSSHYLWEKRDLAALFGDSSLVIVKGDMNYRRMLGDAIWEPTIPFRQAVDYMPAPVLALRTMKSDVIVGLPPGMAETLTSADPDWHTNGRRGMIAFKKS